MQSHRNSFAAPIQPQTVTSNAVDAMPAFNPTNENRQTLINLNNFNPASPQQFQSRPGPASVISVAGSSKGARRRDSATQGDKKMAPIATSTPPPSPLISQSSFVAPKSMDEAMSSFEQTRKMAQGQIRHNTFASTRLISAMADLTVVLLTRAMKEGILNSIEIRIMKKPSIAGNGYLVAEYRDASQKSKKVADQAASNETSDSDFTIILAEELLPGEFGRDKDNVENWKKFFDVVRGYSLWWRYSMAVHRRIGWKVKIDRSVLNVVDSRVLGFVTIKISNYV